MRGVPDLTSAVSLNWLGDPKRYRWVVVLGAGHRCADRGAFTARNGYRIAGQGARIAGQGARLLDRRPRCAALGSPAKVRGQYRENRGPQCAANAARSAAALRSYKCKAKRPRGVALLHSFILGIKKPALSGHIGRV